MFQATIEEAKDHWLEPLQGLIAKINKSFSYFFSRLKCAGEVDLHIPDNRVCCCFKRLWSLLLLFEGVVVLLIVKVKEHTVL